tara:strand:+ start:3231 stop:3410 length:180 start_codon:yes stop_codon:yes gene_type:complete
MIVAKPLVINAIAPPEPAAAQQFTRCDVTRVTVEAIHTSIAPPSFLAEQPTTVVSVKMA